MCSVQFEGRWELKADDLLLGTSSSSLKTLESILNQALCNLQEWSNKNWLIVSTSKTVYHNISFSTEQTIVEGDQSEETWRNLGVIIDKKMIGEVHIDLRKAKMSLAQATDQEGVRQDLLITNYIRPDKGAQTDIDPL